MTLQPTKKSEWVKEGDRVRHIQSGWTGLVLRIIPSGSLPDARVQWDRNGYVGRVRITYLETEK